MQTFRFCPASDIATQSVYPDKTMPRQISRSVRYRRNRDFRRTMRELSQSSACLAYDARMNCNSRFHAFRRGISSLLYGTHVRAIGRPDNFASNGHANRRQMMVAQEPSVRSSRPEATPACAAPCLSDVLTGMLLNTEAAIRWLDRPHPNVAEALEALRGIRQCQIVAAPFPTSSNDA